MNNTDTLNATTTLTLTVEADSAGVVFASVLPGAVVTVLDEDWLAAPVFKNKPIVSTCWVYRLITVKGVVRAEPGDVTLNLSTVEVHALIDHDPESAGPDGPYLSHMLRKVKASTQPRADGSFAMTVPRLDPLVIAATARGWKTARQPLPSPSPREGQFVELWLERALRIRGQLLSSDGIPLRRVPVVAYVVVVSKGTAADLSADKLRLRKPNGGITGGTGPTMGGRVVIKFLYLARTDSLGKFEIGAAESGTIVLVAYPNGHRPAERELGQPSTDVNDVKLTAEPVHGAPSTRLVAGKLRLADRKVVLSDLTLLDGTAQPGVKLQTGAMGNLPTAWLIEGRAYHLMVGRIEYHGCLVWDGRASLDVTRDLVSFDEVRRQ